MEWGDKIKSLEIRKRKGLSAEALDNRPEKTLVTDWFIKSFFTLRSSAGPLNPFDPNLKPITLLEIKTYTELFDIITNNAEFVETIQGLDRVYLNHAEKLRNARNKFNSSNRRGGRRSIGKATN